MHTCKSEMLWAFQIYRWISSTEVYYCNIIIRVLDMLGRIINVGESMNSAEYLVNLKKQLAAENKGKKYQEACISYANRLLQSNLPVIFDIKHFALLLGMKSADLSALLFVDPDLLYTRRLIPKKNGDKREILMPCILLKYIQRWLLDNILVNIPNSPHAMGFREGLSIVTNAQIHVDQDCIVNIDLKDFFPTITTEDVFRIFKYYGYTKELSYAFAKLCTFKGKLPQGSPASPCISNIRCLKLDKRLAATAGLYNAKYTRYADDITISGAANITHIVPLVRQIIADEGLIVNENKVHISYRHQHQQVTGLTVNNNAVRVNKAYKRKLQQEIYYCKKYGPYNHQEHVDDEHLFFKEHLYGKAYFVCMVEPEVGKRMLADLDTIDWDY